VPASVTKMAEELDLWFRRNGVVVCMSRKSVPHCCHECGRDLVNTGFKFSAGALTFIYHSLSLEDEVRAWVRRHDCHLWRVSSNDIRHTRKAKSEDADQRVDICIQKVLSTNPGISCLTHLTSSSAERVVKGRGAATRRSVPVSEASDLNKFVRLPDIKQLCLYMQELEALSYILE
jgi:DNA-binding protein